MSQGSKNQQAKKHKRQAHLVLNRLFKQALMGDDEGEPMTMAQIRAADLALRKTIPDLRSTELRGKVDSKIEVLLRRED